MHIHALIASGSAPGTSPPFKNASPMVDLLVINCQHAYPTHLYSNLIASLLDCSVNCSMAFSSYTPLHNRDSP